MDFDRNRLAVAIATSAALLYGTQVFACGTERWSVKIGTDQDARSVHHGPPITTTIKYLTSLKAPKPIPKSRRVAPTELTIYKLNATLVGYKVESDRDYHLVLKDDQGRTMIAEIPSPDCVQRRGPFAAAVTIARHKFDSQLSVSTQFQQVDIPVQVIGVGFFDFIHGQTGVAPNGIELHPVLDITFNPLK